MLAQRYDLSMTGATSTSAPQNRAARWKSPRNSRRLARSVSAAIVVAFPLACLVLAYDLRLARLLAVIVVAELLLIMVLWLAARSWSQWRHPFGLLAAALFVVLVPPLFIDATKSSFLSTQSLMRVNLLLIWTVVAITAWTLLDRWRRRAVPNDRETFVAVAIGVLAAALAIGPPLPAMATVGRPADFTMVYQVECDQVTTMMDDRLFELETSIGARYVGEIGTNSVVFADVPAHVKLRVLIYNTTEFRVTLNDKVVEAVRPKLDAGKTPWLDRDYGLGYFSILSELLTAGIVKSEGMSLSLNLGCPEDQT